MKQFFIIVLLFIFSVTTEVLSLDCPKNLTISFTSPKAE
jgi:hypothetical protein